MTVPADVPVEDHEAWITERRDELLGQAISEDRCDVRVEDSVEGQDTQWDITPCDTTNPPSD